MLSQAFTLIIFSQRDWHSQCIETGLNNELCMCGVNENHRNIDEWFIEQQIKYGVDMKMKQGEDLTPDYATLPYDQLRDELRAKTVWDFCRCPEPNRNIPIYTQPRHKPVPSDDGDDAYISQKCHFPFHYGQFTYDKASARVYLAFVDKFKSVLICPCQRR